MLAQSTWARDPAIGETPEPGAESKNVETESDDAKQFNIRYAEVYRKIAEINLHKAAESNRRVPNTIPAAEIDRLKEILHLANAQYKAAASGDDQSIALENSTSQIKVAEEALQKGVAANNRAPGSVPQIELDRLRLLAELSRLQLAKDQAAHESKTSAVKMQKRVDRLEQQVRDLQSQVAELLAKTDAKAVVGSQRQTAKTAK